MIYSARFLTIRFIGGVQRSVSLLIYAIRSSSRGMKGAGDSGTWQPLQAIISRYIVAEE